VTLIKIKAVKRIKPLSGVASVTAASSDHCVSYINHQVAVVTILHETKEQSWGEEMLDPPCVSPLYPLN